MRGAIPFFDQDAGVLRLWRRQLGLAPQLHAAPLGGLDPRLCSLDDQAALKLRQRADNMAEQPTRGAIASVSERKPTPCPFRLSSTPTRWGSDRPSRSSF
jgi:hypothetical protein